MRTTLAAKLSDDLFNITKSLLIDISSGLLDHAHESINWNISPKSLSITLQTFKSKMHLSSFVIHECFVDQFAWGCLMALMYVKCLKLVFIGCLSFFFTGSYQGCGASAFKCCDAWMYAREKFLPLAPDHPLLTFYSNGAEESILWWVLVNIKRCSNQTLKL